MSDSAPSHTDLLAEVERLRARVALLETSAPPSISTHLADPHLILEHINDSVVVVDAELRILRWNRAAELLYGWRAAEVLGRRTLDVVPLRYPDDTARLAAVQALRETRYWRGEALATRRDGTEIVVEGSSQMLCDAAGAMIGIINIGRDVTERSRAAAEREQLIASERAARQQAETVQTRLEILARASQIFADASLDLQAVLRQVTQHIAEVVGDACAIRLLSEDGCALEPQSFYHPNAATRSLLHTILFSTPVSVADGPYAQVLRTRQPLALSLAPAPAQLPPQFQQYVDQFAAHTALIAPLSVRGRVIGTLTVVRDETPHAFTDDDRMMIQELADRAATAIDNARLYAAAQTMSREKSEALALLDTLFATAPIGLAFSDHNLRYVRINQNLAEINGLPMADHLGRAVSDVLPELAATVEPLYRQVLATGEAVHGVEIHGSTLARPGVPRDWLASYYPVRSADATVMGVGSVVLEVTERKQAERDVRASEASLRAILESANQLFLLLDGELRVVQWNTRAATEIATQFGLTLCAGTPISAYMPAEGAAEGLALMQRALLGERSSLEINVGSAAAACWAVVEYAPVRDDGGQIVGVCISALDVSEQRRAAAELRASEERFRTIIENSQDATVFTDGESRIHYCNSAITNILGYSPAELVGQRFRALIEPEDARASEAVHGPRAVLPGSLTEWAVRARHKDGSWRWIQARRNNQLANPAIGYVVSSFHDVTLQKQAEDALHDYTRQLQALSRRLVEVQEAERRHLARELHDEIGQMLTGLNLLLEPGRTRSGTEIIGRLAEAQALVNELTGRVRQLSLDLRPSMLDDFGLLATLRWHVERYTAHTEMTVDFKHVGLDQPLPPHVAVTAYRIVQEALTNVARYAQVTTVSLRAWRTAHALSLEIEDQGCGFDPDLVLSAGRSNGIAGMRERVLLLGGTIQIDSAPGTGTRVLVDLPLAGSDLSEESR